MERIEHRKERIRDIKLRRVFWLTISGVVVVSLACCLASGCLRRDQSQMEMQMKEIPIALETQSGN